MSTKPLDIKLNDVKEQSNHIDVEEIVRFIYSGQYGATNNSHVKQFEHSWSKYHSNIYSVMCNSGTSAYITSLYALGVSKEDTCILLQNNSWASVLFSTKQLGYNYSFIDTDSSLQINVDELEEWLKINSKSYKSIVVVLTHILGYSGNYSRILKLKDKYNLYIIEDCSQAHGSIDKNNRIVGASTSDIAFWSFYPTKPLGSIVEAGILSCNSTLKYKKAKAYINCGMYDKYKFSEQGLNLRPSPISAICLDNKLYYLDQWNLEKNFLAELYKKEIKNKQILVSSSDLRPSYHYFPILVKNREYILQKLDKYKIPYNINYPFTLSTLDNTVGYPVSHKQSEMIISLPCHPDLTEEQVKFICKVINSYT